MRTISARTLRTSLATLTFAVIAFGAREAASQQTVYVAKFVCGRAVAARVPPPVAPGVYFTAINVHTIDDNKFEKRFSVALPSEKAGKVSNTVVTVMKPNEALEIDCPDILRHLEMPQSAFAKGFVTIHSARDLDVVAVYTAAASANSTVAALAVERVPKR